MNNLHIADARNADKVMTFTDLTLKTDTFRVEAIDTTSSPQVVSAPTEIIPQPAGSAKTWGGHVIKKGKHYCSCGNVYAMKQHLKRHQNSQTKFHCEICGAIIGRADNLKAHMKTHDKNKNVHVSIRFALCTFSVLFCLALPVLKYCVEADSSSSCNQLISIDFYSTNNKHSKFPYYHDS